ncbi:MAG: NAD(P)/FAD-dependent oxidoreductase [Hyphomicrobiales bacterium]
MSTETINTLVVGGGQAGLAMSEHLRDNGVEHLVLERDRIAERWRTNRWDSLVANGPAWHDRFPTKEFGDIGGDGFPTKHSVTAYFEEFAEQINAPIRCGIEVLSAEKEQSGSGFLVETTQGTIKAQNIVAATGPFQHPVIPPVVPNDVDVLQMHSTAYRNPDQLPEGAVMVVGAGSSGSQIADELLRSGRKVYLSVGPHDRPPRSYRGKDFCWWLGVLGKWEMKTPPAGREHVTIAVSGAYGGHTVDFRELAERGMNLCGMTQAYKDGTLTFASDLATNIKEGDDNLLSLLAEADDYVTAQALDLPLEEEAKTIRPEPQSMTNPTLSIDLAVEGISTIIWATGFKQDFGWLKVDAFHEDGRPDHVDGVSKQDGIYFLGLPWLSMRGSSFIWGVWVDAKHLGQHIAGRNKSQDL